MDLQEGIFYSRTQRIGNSFLILFLRASRSASAYEIGIQLRSLWTMYRDLKKGIVRGLNVDEKHRSSGNLSVLIAYGKNIFNMSTLKSRPFDFRDEWLFKSPCQNGRRNILDNSNISYAEDVNYNHAIDDDIVIQFIADSEFFTNRALVETWREISKFRADTGLSGPLQIEKFYSGFQRGDKRNWLGFHDGVSNLRSNERKNVIFMEGSTLPLKDKWLVNGTYLAFIRITLDLEAWDNLAVNEQEVIIGRDKLTGCPLVTDKRGRTTKYNGCPVPGTSEVIERGNERFRELAFGPSLSMMPRPRGYALPKSHTYVMRVQGRYRPSDKRSFRIFRQGFESIEYTSEKPGFRVGLNFVSFQNTPERIHGTLENAFRQRPAGPGIPSLDKFMAVQAAGIFLVPPLGKDEHFPGSSIFFGSRGMLRHAGRRAAG